MNILSNKIILINIYHIYDKYLTKSILDVLRSMKYLTKCILNVFEKSLKYIFSCYDL